MEWNLTLVVYKNVVCRSVPRRTDIEYFMYTGNYAVQPFHLRLLDVNIFQR